MVSRPVAVGRHPQVLAAMHVDRGDPTIGWLHDGESVEGRYIGSVVADHVAERRVVAFRLFQGVHARPGVGHGVVDAGLGIEGAGVPVPRSPPSRIRQGADLPLLVVQQAGRREHRPEPEGLDELQGPRPELRREVDQVVLHESLAVEGRRLRRERLGRRQSLPWDPRAGHGPLFDRPHRLPGTAIEDVEEAGLRGLHDGVDPLPVDRDLAEGRRADRVPFPDVVAHRLKVPDPLARSGVERDERVGVQVVAGPVAAVVRGGRRRDLDVDVAELLVGRQAAPRPEVARVLPRAVAPGLVARLARPRHDVERPQPAARADVVAAHILRRRLLLAAAVAGAAGVSGHHDDVAHDDRPGRPGEVAGQRSREADADPPLVAEVAVEFATRGVDRVQPVVACEEQSFLLAVGPEVDASRVRAARLLDRRLEGRLGPQRLAGRRVDGAQQADEVGQEEATFDHDGRRPQVVARTQPGELLLELRFQTRPPPHDAQIADVRGVDPVERRVALEGAVAAEVRPLAFLRRQGGRQRQHAGTREQGSTPGARPGIRVCEHLSTIAHRMGDSCGADAALTPRTSSGATA